MLSRIHLAGGIRLRVREGGIGMLSRIHLVGGIRLRVREGGIGLLSRIDISTPDTGVSFSIKINATFTVSHIECAPLSLLQLTGIRSADRPRPQGGCLRVIWGGEAQMVGFQRRIDTHRRRIRPANESLISRSLSPLRPVVQHIWAMGLYACRTCWPGGGQRTWV